MTAATATRPEFQTLSNEALSALTLAEIRACYTYAVRARNVVAGRSTVAQEVLEAYIRRIAVVGDKVSRQANSVGYLSQRQYLRQFRSECE